MLTSTTKTKEYIRPMPATWWLKKPNYTTFMVRELSAVFIGLYALFLVCVLWHVNRDTGEAFGEYVNDTLASPWSYLLHGIALFFALFNTVTFIGITPRVIVIQRGEDRVPDAVVAGIHWAMFVLATVGLIALAVVAAKSLS